MKQLRQKLILRIFIIFMVVNGAALSAGAWLDAHKVDHFVLICANGILFLLAAANLLLSTKALGNSNPNVFVRSIMAATFIKLMVIVAALAIYILASGKNRSLGAVFAGLALYIVYTIFEVRAALQLNSFKDAGN